MKKTVFALAVMAIGFGVPALAAVTHVRATVYDGDDVVGAYRYTPKAFDSVEECKAFLANPDERFIAATQNMQDQAAQMNYTVKIECVED